MPASQVARRIAVLLVMLEVCLARPALALPPKSSPTGPLMPFLFSAEFIGAEPQTSPAALQFVKDGVVNCVKFWPPVSAATLDWIRAQKLGFVLWCPGSDEIKTRMKSMDRLATTDLNEERGKLEALSSAPRCRVWWDVMPEFDQSGGHWVAGRPSPAGLTRRQAFPAWRDFYLNLRPLGTYLGQTPAQRGFNLAATNVYAFSSHYAYEMGVELLLLERNNDEIGDLQTGTAFLRGAARQYGKPWGIDISAWRGLSDAPTEYGAGMRQISGWSLSYHRRQLYLSYMAGANIVQMEAMSYQTGGKLNPLGQLVEEFGDFALRRHPDPGRAVVTTALMLDHDHGFEPKCGRWTQGDYVWYWKLPYNDGDHMTHQVLNLLYPGYWRSGTVVPGAPTTPQAYNAALVAGADPRPWEPMGDSTWGDQFDVLLSNAGSSALDQYQTIVLVGSIQLTPELEKRLLPWVQSGGTLVVNAAQSQGASEAFLGCRITPEMRVASSSQWLADGRPSAESAYSYAVADPGRAAVLARTPEGDPLVVRNSVGAGAVITTMPYCMMDQQKSGILQVCRRLMGALVQPKLPAQVTGPFAVDYIVSTRRDATIVTVCNNSGQPWSGRITAPATPAGCRATEWLTDASVPYQTVGRKAIMSAQVPPYDVRVFAVETAR